MRPDFDIALELFKGKAILSADSFSLRDYQERDVNIIRRVFSQKYQRPCYVAPTGAGKTVVFAYIAIHSRYRGNKVYVLSHRRLLITQISKMFDEMGIGHGIIAAGFTPKPDEQIQLVSKDSLIRRLDKIEKPTFLIIDECHRATSKTFKQIIDWADCKVLGVTATPERRDGTGLGIVFDVIVPGPSVKELITGKWLAQPEVYAPPIGINLSKVKSKRGDFEINELALATDKTTITGDAVKHYIKYIGKGKRAIAFCVNIQHTKNVAAEFIKQDITAEAIDGTMSDKEIQAALGRFEDGTTAVLCSAELINEGLNIPAVEGIIGLRGTKSLAVWRQQVGRAMRLVEGKTHCKIMDHVGNTYRHGLPDDDINWTLAGKVKVLGKKKEKPKTLTTCKQCFAVYPPDNEVCPQCGWQSNKTREIKQKDGELIKLSGDKIVISKDQKRDLTRKAKTLEDLVAVGKQFKYRYPMAWAKHVLESRVRKYGNRRSSSQIRDPQEPRQLSIPPSVQ